MVFFLGTNIFRNLGLFFHLGEFTDWVSRRVPEVQYLTPRKGASWPRKPFLLHHGRMMAVGSMGLTEEKWQCDDRLPLKNA
jgi:hypothetical protein